jgi:hypothetical protein
VRWGDPTNPVYFGDYTHPTSGAEKKVADRLVDFITNTQNPNNAWVAPWIKQ